MFIVEVIISWHVDRVTLTYCRHMYNVTGLILSYTTVCIKNGRIMASIKVKNILNFWYLKITIPTCSCLEGAAIHCFLFKDFAFVITCYHTFSLFRGCNILLNARQQVWVSQALGVYYCTWMSCVTVYMYVTRERHLTA